MLHFVDTNISLRYVSDVGANSKIVRLALRRLAIRKHTFCTSTQNCIEFWNVATRPLSKNGFGRTPEEAERMLRRVIRRFHFISDSSLVFPEWRRLVRKYAVSGVQVHDARFVAVMRVHGITHILTLNGADFARFAPEGIVVVDPASV